MTPTRHNYRQQMQNLGNPPLSEWGELAKSHWEQHLPKMVGELRRLGVYRDALILARRTPRRCTRR